jgi:hypothetical protein
MAPHEAQDRRRTQLTPSGKAWLEQEQNRDSVMGAYLALADKTYTRAEVAREIAHIIPQLDRDRANNPGNAVVISELREVLATMGALEQVAYARGHLERA